MVNLVNWRYFIIFSTYFVAEISAQNPSGKVEPACNIPAVANAKVKRSTPKPTCSLPIQSLYKGRLAKGPAPRPYGLLPPWANLTLARQGQKFAQDHRFSVNLATLFGLTMILFAYDGNDILLATHKSDTAEKAKKRYVATGAQAEIWYYDPISEKNDSDIQTSIRNVRALHSAAAAAYAEKYSRNEPAIDDKYYANVTLDNEMWAALAQDLDELKLPAAAQKLPPYYNNIEGHALPVSQFMFLMTHFAFSFPIIFTEKLGINTTDDNVWAFNHLFAILGYALGIEDQYNIYLQPDPPTQRKYFKEFLNTYYIPQMFNPAFRTKVLVEALLRGEELMYPALHRNIILYKVLKNVLNIPAYNLRKRFTPEQEKGEEYFETTLKPMLLNSPEFRIAFNKKVMDDDRTLGVKCFGKDFETQQSRAKRVF